MLASQNQHYHPIWMPYLDHQLDKHKFFFHIAEVKHVLNSAFKKRRCKFGFWNLTVQLIISPISKSQTSHYTAAFVSVWRKTRRFLNRGKVFVCFEDELCRILVAHLSRPPRSDIKSLWRLRWNFRCLGRKTIPKKVRYQTSETNGPEYPRSSISQMQAMALVGPISEANNTQVWWRRLVPCDCSQQIRKCNHWIITGVS